MTLLILMAAVAFFVWRRIGKAERDLLQVTDRLRAVERECDTLSAKLASLAVSASAPSPVAPRPEAERPAPPAGPPVPATSRPPALPRAVVETPSASARPTAPAPAPTVTPPRAGPPITPPRLAPPRGAPPPSAPGAFDVLSSWLFGGNLIVRVGVVVLLFGVGFFLNFAIEQGWLPVEVRLTLAAASGLALTGVGWRLRDRRRDYALVLQGGGIGIVYLTVFAASNLYALVAPGPALALMVALVTLSNALAVLQDARSLAVFATAAGFLAPLLVSSEGSHVGLFAYYAVLNLGILGIAWFKAWRLLNLLGFAFTFVVSLAWGAQYYEPRFFATTEPFLVGFFLLYVAVPVLFARREVTGEARMVDGTLLFGVPVVAFGLQAGLVGDYEYGLAFSALGAGLVYATLARMLWRRVPETTRLLTEAFLALAVAFGTLTIPLAVDGRWTGAAWALEGAGLVWVGVRQGRRLARLSGVALQLLAGGAFLIAAEQPAADVAVLNSLYLGALLISAAGLFCAWYLDRHRASLDTLAASMPAPLVAWGLLWWLGAGVREIVQHVPAGNWIAALLGLLALTTASLTWARGRLAWRPLAIPPILQLPAMLGLTAVTLLAQAFGEHPLGGWNAFAWAAAIGAHLWAQFRLESEWPGRVPRYWHAGTLWLLLILASSELAWAAGRVAGTGAIWYAVGWAVVPAVAIVVVPPLARLGSWPFAAFGTTYVAALAPVVAALGFWVFTGTFHEGDPQPLPYVPLLNPLELMQGLTLAIVAGAHREGVTRFLGSVRWPLLSALAFLALNGALARAVHVFGDIAFDPNALWASPRYQTAVSIAWTATAIGAMLGARWRAGRPLWFAGAMLIAAVVAKLFLVDLAGVGTVARIVSFVVVGLLILVVGYLSPLPPRAAEEAP